MTTLPPQEKSIQCAHEERVIIQEVQVRQEGGFTSQAEEGHNQQSQQGKKRRKANQEP